MKRRMTGLVTLTVFALAGTAPAITVDGQWNDWFSYSGTSDNNWRQDLAANSLLNPNFRYQNDPDNDAYGGQNYDAEQIFYYYEDYDANTFSGGKLYIGLVTGYEPTNTTYRSGDMFIDLGANGVFDLAVATGTESNSRFGDIWQNDGWSLSGVNIPSHSGNNPYRVRNSRSGATYYGNAVIDWDTGVGPGSAHNFLELSLELNGAHEQIIAYAGIGLHWTMQCGNDAINVLDHNPLIPPPPPPPNTPVPEPATLLLLGMGIAGIGLRARRPSR